MPRPQPHLEEVLASEPGPHIAALFDFDGTIISGYSATAMLREKFQRRQMSVEEVADSFGFEPRPLTQRPRPDTQPVAPNSPGPSAFVPGSPSPARCCGPRWDACCGPPCSGS